jgi:acid phosphatase
VLPSRSRIESLEARELLNHPHPAAATLPRPDHVVIVMEENHSLSSLFGRHGPSIPYLRSWANQGALFANSWGITHPSQPNYLALFSGSTHGSTDDSYITPYSFSGPDLGSELRAKGFSFTGYSEDLPYAGFTGDTSNGYEKKHNPWVDFNDVKWSASQPMTSFPSWRRLDRLPTVSFVIPTDANNMHDGTPTAADAWLQNHLSAYVQWAQTHNSLLIVQWDEGSPVDNNIPTLFVGPMVKPGVYKEKISHYNLLRTVEDMYGLGYAGASASAVPITDTWTSAAAIASSTAQPAAVFSTKDLFAGLTPDRRSIFSPT